MHNFSHGSGLVKGGAEGDRKLTAKEMDEKLKEDQNIITAKKRPENKKIIITSFIIAPFLN